MKFFFKFCYDESRVVMTMEQVNPINLFLVHPFLEVLNVYKALPILAGGISTISKSGQGLESMPSFQ